MKLFKKMMEEFKLFKDKNCRCKSLQFFIIRRKQNLTLNVEDYILNIRAAGVIIHDNKVLTHKNTNSNHYCLPGGRVEIGESSEETIKREISEELGKEIQILDYITTIENFFEMDNKKQNLLMMKIKE